MRLPSNFVQLSTAQEKKFFELLFLANSYCAPDDKLQWNNSIDKNTGLISGLDLHWFELTYEFIGNVLLHKRYDAKNLLWHRGIERMTQNPIDFLSEYHEKYSRGKQAFNFKLQPNSRIWFLDISDDDKHLFLEVFDYCQTLCPVLGNRNITPVLDDKGMIEGTPFHWYQTLFNYIIPTLIYGKKYGCAKHFELEYEKYFSVCGNLMYSIRYKSPFNLLRDMYRKKMLDVPFVDKMEEHEYVRALQAREDRRIEREKKEKQKNR
jgi:hypothetical protein